MSGKVIAGIALIVIGGLILAYQGFSYTQREKKVDLGPIQISADEKKTVPLPPILGGVLVLGGVVVLVTARKS